VLDNKFFLVILVLSAYMIDKTKRYLFSITNKQPQIPALVIIGKSRIGKKDLPSYRLVTDFTLNVAYEEFFRPLVVSPRPHIPL
jgi:hypothetical protein